jgi:hypothetical protein
VGVGGGVQAVAIAAVDSVSARRHLEAFRGEAARPSIASMSTFRSHRALLAVLVGLDLLVPALSLATTLPGGWPKWDQCGRSIRLRVSIADVDPAHRADARSAIDRWNRDSVAALKVTNSKKGDILLATGPVYDEHGRRRWGVAIPTAGRYLEKVRVRVDPGVTPRSEMRAVFCHEIGHALGLGHRRQGCMHDPPLASVPSSESIKRLEERYRCGAGSAGNEGDEPDPPPNRLVGGQQLLPNQSIVSSSGRLTLIHQGDGNVVLYREGRALWSSGTHGRATSRLVMQTDGNLVLYAPSGAAVWHTFTYGNPGASLVLQDDCNLVVYSAGGAALWNTGTWQACVPHTCSVRCCGDGALGPLVLEGAQVTSQQECLDLAHAHCASRHCRSAQHVRYDGHLILDKGCRCCALCGPQFDGSGSAWSRYRVVENVCSDCTQRAADVCHAQNRRFLDARWDDRDPGNWAFCE